jgi:hypothetical protein
MSSQMTIYLLMLLVLFSAVAGLWLGPLTNILVVLVILVASILVWRTTARYKLTWTTLMVLEAFLVTSTLAGGVGILRGDFTLPSSWLYGTAFSDYAIPGVMLLVISAISVVGAATLFVEGECATLVSVLAGVFMAGYEVVEIACIDSKVGGSLPIVLAAQLLWLAAGLAVALLAGNMWIRNHHSQSFQVSGTSHAPGRV